jgi:hypothetical protein
MRVYTPDELRRFLEGVDAALRGDAEVVVIGGAAAPSSTGSRAARVTSIRGRERGCRRTGRWRHRAAAAKSGQDLWSDPDLLHRFRIPVLGRHVVGRTFKPAIGVTHSASAVSSQTLMCASPATPWPGASVRLGRLSSSCGRHTGRMWRPESGRLPDEPDAGGVTSTNEPVGCPPRAAKSRCGLERLGPSRLAWDPETDAFTTVPRSCPG